VNPLMMRVHLLDGILRCVDRWEEVGAIVAGAQDREKAADLIQARIGLDPQQVSAFLDQHFGRFTQDGVRRMRQELSDLRAAG
jgi:DNA gyrase/topoisomerase IV subunit A